MRKNKNSNTILRKFGITSTRTKKISASANGCEPKRLKTLITFVEVPKVEGTKNSEHGGVRKRQKEHWQNIAKQHKKHIKSGAKNK